MSRLARRAAWAGLAGLVLSGFSGALEPAAFFRGWLAAFVAASAVPLGAPAILFTARLVPGAWGEELGPALRRATALLPIVALFLVPVLIGVAWIYPWATASPNGTKGALMTVPLFFLRGVLYVGLWIAVASAWWRNAGAATASAGLVIWAVTGSLAGIDWAMSVEPEFHSSVFGLFILAHFLIGALAFAIIAAPRPHQRPGALGAVLLSICLLWMYLEAMQFIIVWSGDLPQETTWYLHRVAGAWPIVLTAIFLLSGALPFALLLSARGRQSPTAIIVAAGSMLTGRVIEAAWLVLPAYAPSLLTFLAFVGATVGMAGLFLSAFVGRGAPRGTDRAAPYTARR